MRWSIALHGGAGLIRRASLTPEREARCRAGLLSALRAGTERLAAGASSLEAVEAAVVALEDDEHFNAGRGAVLAAGGRIEFDAAIMSGSDRRAGAVGMATVPRNPIRLARAVMEHTPHVLLVADGADQLARELQLPLADATWFEVPDRRAQYEQAAASGAFTLDHGSDDKDVYGTVGAVACDLHGHVASATSTGGMVNKRRGRLGDTPVIGAGTFAWDATCAVSGTGHGEPFQRLGVAHRVSAYMELAGMSLADAAERVIHHDLPQLAGQGGLIAVDAAGRLALPFNTAGMSRAWQTADSQEQVAVW
jgi:beta-aspartyl-peptidase (threonine type)